MKTQLYSISKWASQHISFTRLIIVILHLVLIVLGWSTGLLLRDMGWILPGYALTGSMVCMVLLVIFYPAKNGIKTERIRHYYKRKRFDTGLLMIGFFMFCMVTDRGFEDVLSIPAAMAVNRSVDMMTSRADSCYIGSLPTMSSHDDGSAAAKMSKKEMRKYVKQQIKASVDNGKMGKGTAAFLILLSIFAGLLIIWVMSLLSCSLACSGSGALAVFVLVLGVAGGFLVMFSLIRTINKKRKASQEVPVS